LDSQKEILTKLHKNGFNDGVISALYFSTLNICAFKKSFCENAAFIKKIPYSVKDIIVATERIAKSNKNDTRVSKEFEGKLELATLKEDKIELQEELKVNISNSTNFNVKLIVDTANKEKPVTDGVVTLAAVLNVKPVIVENDGQIAQ
jgi:hypothetical protein